MSGKKVKTAVGKERNCPDGSFLKNLWLITAAALFIRIIASWEMAAAFGGVNNVFDPSPSSDLATYMRLGSECAKGIFPETFYYQPWYYSVFLAVCNIVGMGSVWFVIFVQCIASALTVWLTGWCGRKVFSSEKAGLCAAGLCAVSSSLILYVPFHQNETLQTFHVILLFAAVLLSLEKNRISLWLGSGILFGIAVLTRGNVWLLMPAVIWGIFYFGKKSAVSLSRRFAAAGIFLAASLAVQLPFIIHNSINCGTLSAPSTAAGAVLALGNTPEAPAGGREPGSTSGTMVYPEAYRRMMANAEKEDAVSVPKQMWEWFADDPAAFLELQFRKALLFWDHREIPNNVSLDHDGIMCSYVLKYLVIGRSAVLFVLGIAGILYFAAELFRERKMELTMLYCFSFLFYVSAVVFYILSRFKAPFIPFLAVFGGGALCRWIQEYSIVPKEKKRMFLGKVFLCLLAGIWFSTAAYDTYRNCEPIVNKFIYPDGIALDMNGETIHFFDHGPQPFGGWNDIELKNGSTMIKKFASRINGEVEIQMTFRSFEYCQLVIMVNGVSFSYRFPQTAAGKTGRKIVRMQVPIKDGIVEMRVLSVSGGRVWGCCDIQRDYGRSMLDGETISGEWVMRVVVPKE